MLLNTSLVASWVMCWTPVLHHASNLLSHWNIKENSEHLKDTLNQSRNTSTTDLMFLTSTCHWPNVLCSFHAYHMISKLFPKSKSLVQFWWKARLTRKLNNKISISFPFAAMSQNCGITLPPGNRDFYEDVMSPLKPFLNLFRLKWNFGEGIAQL